MSLRSKDEVWVWQWAQNFSEGKDGEVKVTFRVILVRKVEGYCMKFKLMIPFDLREYVCEWVFPLFLHLLNPINVSGILPFLSFLQVHFLDLAVCRISTASFKRWSK